MSQLTILAFCESRNSFADTEYFSAIEFATNHLLYAEPNSTFSINNRPRLAGFTPVARQISAMGVEHSDWKQVNNTLRQDTGVVNADGDVRATCTQQISMFENACTSSEGNIP